MGIDLKEPQLVMQPWHYLELDTSFGEPTLRLVCAAGPGAPCRRRPSDSDRETWSLDDPDLVDADCWAVEWVEAAGFSDAVRCSPDARFGRIPVAVSYDEGVVVAPAGQPDLLAAEAAVPEPVLEDGSATSWTIPQIRALVLSAVSQAHNAGPGYLAAAGRAFDDAIAAHNAQLRKATLSDAAKRIDLDVHFPSDTLHPFQAAQASAETWLEEEARRD